MGICLIVAFFFGDIYKNKISNFQLLESYGMILILSVNFLITLVNTLFYVVLTGYEQFIIQRSIQLMVAIIQPVSIIVCVYYFPFAVSIVIVQFTINLLQLLANAYIAVHDLGIKFNKTSNYNVIKKEVIKYTMQVLITIIADVLYFRGMPIIIGAKLNLFNVAIYAIGSQFINAYKSFGIIFSSVSMPRITKLYTLGMHQKIIEILSRTSKYSAIFLLLILSGFFVFGDYFIMVWINGGYYESYYIALIVMAGASINQIQNVVGIILQVVDKYKFRSYSYLIIALFVAVLVCNYCEQLGAVGVACVVSFGLIISDGVLLNIYIYKELNVNFYRYTKMIARIIAVVFIYCSLWRIGVVTAFEQVSVFTLAFMVVVYLIIYCILMYKMVLSKPEQVLFLLKARKFIRQK